MGTQQFVEHLTRMGLTRQEAVIYEQLLIAGKQTGYEIAKVTGISRSNTYSTLSNLVDKGAAYVVEESAKRYTPVGLDEFCDNYIRRMQDTMNWLIEHLPQKQTNEDGYITIDGAEHILDKAKTLITQVEDRVYITAKAEYLELFRLELEQLLLDGKKVVLVTDTDYKMSKAKIYISENRGNQIGIITDSKYTLTGEYGDGSTNTCLYSGQRNLVSLFKTALANEIKLINYTKGENTRNEKRNIRNESAARGNRKRISNSITSLR